jgi:hypothetical protein
VDRGVDGNTILYICASYVNMGIICGSSSVVAFYGHGTKLSVSIYMTGILTSLKRYHVAQWNVLDGNSAITELRFLI